MEEAPHPAAAQKDARSTPPFTRESMRRSGMNARVVPDVRRTGFHAGSYRASASHEGGVIHVSVVDSRRQTGLHKWSPAQRSNLTAPRARIHAYGETLDALRLAASDCPDICSDMDARHGCGGDRPRSPGAFRHRRLSPSSGRQYRCMGRLQTSRTTPHRSAKGGSASRANDFAAGLSSSYRAPAHLQ